MKIRVFERKDESEVISLWSRCNLVVPSNNPEQDIKRKLDAGGDLFLVGQARGRIIASIMGGYDGHRGWINYLAVDPELRRRGLGRQLMAQVERRLKARGCPKINLQVRAGNKTVMAFYKSLGYNVDAVKSLGKRLAEDEPHGG